MPARGLDREALECVRRCVLNRKRMFTVKPANDDEEFYAAVAGITAEQLLMDLSNGAQTI